MSGRAGEPGIVGLTVPDGTRTTPPVLGGTNTAVELESTFPSLQRGTCWGSRHCGAQCPRQHQDYSARAKTGSIFIWGRPSWAELGYLIRAYFKRYELLFDLS
ncbi:hypothetical protein NDU88_005109 [Pleurodeles waltl]|uniref:Uncharacterized protein n=1 Tax=Pleurodeles waltl TaxID=8319 RepID=A0AAV7LK75_PLEWA|nr:hypothetical protein NDU88_005109 [Pleurodeles waltl]